MPGVYISYPFCAQKCTYCNFASDVLPAELEGRYIDSVVGEIGRHQWKWTPETVYIGGGTPSRLGGPDLQRLLAAVPGHPWVEATIEAAPGGITQELARDWRAAGINRVSLGVQSFVERELRLSARRHSADTVVREVAILRDAGISDINIDLIAGLAGQTSESWLESLQWLSRLRVPHVSVYMLEVDTESRLGLEILDGGERYGAATVPSGDRIAEMYETAVDGLERLGIPRYEISNFARQGHASRHNLKYWRGEPYAGFGVDAHSFDGVIRSSNSDDANDYLNRIDAGGSACVERIVANTDEERFCPKELFHGRKIGRATRMRFNVFSKKGCSRSLVKG
jgi:oxygen-independent coproporphyrinogen-3 oxidase